MMRAVVARRLRPLRARAGDAGRSPTRRRAALFDDEEARKRIEATNAAPRAGPEAARGPHRRARAAAEEPGAGRALPPGRADQGRHRPAARADRGADLRARSSRRSASATSTSISTRGCASSRARRPPRPQRRLRLPRRPPPSRARCRHRPRPPHRPRARAPTSPTEQRAYDAALDQFKGGNYPAAIAGFQAFVKTYPKSPLAPSAQYWVGNAQFAHKDFRGAIASQRQLIASYPDSQKVPDALLNIATAQFELGDAAASRRTLEELIAKYPQSEAAAKARQRLGRADASAAGSRRAPFAARLVAWQRSARPPRPAVAGHARPVPDLAVRDHAAADAGRDGAPVLRALPRRVSRRARARRGAARPRARALERARLLPPRASSARGGAGGRRASTAARFRATPTTIATLPGIGRSTAAAIAAFAFGARAAILDGNVKRVLARHRGIDGFPGAPKVEATLWRASPRRCCRERDIETYTQALMDLGATVCTRTAAALRARVPVARRLRRAARRPRRRAAVAAAGEGAAAARGARAAARARRRRSCSRSGPPVGIWARAVEPARDAARRRRRRALPGALRRRGDACRSRSPRSSTASRISG